MTAKPTYKELERIVRKLEARVAQSGKLESELAARNWLLNALLDNLNVGVFMVEAPTGKPILVNHYATRLLGRGILSGDGRESLAETYKAYKLGTGEYYPEDEMPIIRGLKGEFTSADDMKIVQPDGSEIVLEVFGCPVKDDRGKVIASLATFSDITNRKLTEEALRASEERYKTIIQKIQAAIVVHDADSKIIASNTMAQKLLGLTENQLFGKTSIDPDWRFCNTDGKTMAVDEYPVNQVLANRRPLRNMTVGIFHRGKDQPVWVIANADPVFNESGSIDQVIVTFTDITDRKKAEEALRASEERYASTILASRDGIFDWDIVDGKVFTSDRYDEIHGIRAFEMESFDDWQKLIHPDDRQRIINEVQSQLERQTSISDKEYRIVDPQGTEKWVLSRSMATFDEDGRPLRLFGTVSDITDRKLAEEAHEKLHRQLIQAQKMESVGRLAGGVAHDFNNMLGVIIGNADLAIQNLDPSLRVHEDLREIKAAAKRSADLTRQLLAFARRQTAAPVVLDLNETVEGMLKMLRRLIGEDIELVWMPRANLWPVKIDPAQIDQVLANLCVNARDAIEGVGRITIETRNVASEEVAGIDDPEFSSGDYVCLTFGDNGCGMDEATRENIFEPFFTTKKVGEGTGLGLSTVYGIVKQNDGFISVDSKPGKGAAFKIYLPRTAEVEAADESETAVAIATGSETVLLVEDEGAILRMGKAMLERFGYTVLAAHHPNEALSIAGQSDGKIDLLVTDVVLPEMDGKELKSRIEIHHPEIRVLFISGYTADVIMHRGILQENVNFLQKPFTVDQLVNKVREVLDQPKE